VSFYATVTIQLLEAGIVINDHTLARTLTVLAELTHQCKFKVVQAVTQASNTQADTFTFTHCQIVAQVTVIVLV
jgi:hypothetical protein